MRILLPFFLTTSFGAEMNPKLIENTWMEELVSEDFSKIQPFTRSDFERAVKIFENDDSFVAFEIKENKVSFFSTPFENLESASLFTNPGMAREVFILLNELCKTFALPDTFLILYLGDGLFESPQSPLPIFTRCRRNGIDCS